MIVLKWALYTIWYLVSRPGLSLKENQQTGSMMIQQTVRDQRAGSVTGQWCPVCGWFTPAISGFAPSAANRKQKVSKSENTFPN